MIQWLDRPFVDQKKSPKVPNASSRLGFGVDTIILHYTAAGELPGSLSWFQNPIAQSSAHFLVGRDGHIVQCVPLDQRAWHAGIGSFPIKGREDSAYPDKCAVGIEICNYGLVHQDHDGNFMVQAGRDLRPYDLKRYPTPLPATLHFDGARSGMPAYSVPGFWEPYPAAQVDAVLQLCQALIEEFNVPLQRIVGHEDVGLPLGRKTDPGPLWNWVEFMDRLAGTKSQKCQPLPEDIWSLRKTVK